uniref:Major sperm protein n=1 Tax=Panagrellus redivivus TaxID=6233 RepID=A0A7E4UZ72_PANRE
MEAHTDPSNAIVPPFLSASQPIPGSTGSVAKGVRYVQIDPFQVKFQLAESGPSKKTIQLTNTCGKRIAWRIRSNAPTRYVVNPACGFLTQNEAQTVTLELTDVNKYSERHRFMVQAMEAKDDEKDRRKVWDDKRAQNLDTVQCTRVFSSATGAGQNATDVTGSVSSGSSISVGSTGSTGTSPSGTPTTGSGTGSGSSESASASGSTASASTNTSAVSSGSSGSSSSVGSSSSAGSTMSDWGDRINELTNVVKEQLAAKDKASHAMIQAINEVKHLEVELDRAGQQATELDNRYKTVSAQLDQMEKRSKQLEEEIKSNLIPKTPLKNDFS